MVAHVTEEMLNVPAKKDTPENNAKNWYVIQNVTLAQNPSITMLVSPARKIALTISGEPETNVMAAQNAIMAENVIKTPQNVNAPLHGLERPVKLWYAINNVKHAALLSITANAHLVTRVAQEISTIKTACVSDAQPAITAENVIEEPLNVIALLDSLDQIVAQ